MRDVWNRKKTNYKIEIKDIIIWIFEIKFVYLY